MNRVVAGALGLLAGAALLVGCSDDNSASTASAGDTRTSTGKITVASGAIGGQQGLGIVMTDAATPSVESLGMVVDGSALAVSNMGGMKSGSADVKVDRRIDDCLTIYRSIRAGREPRSRCAGVDVGHRDRPHGVQVHAPGTVSAHGARGRCARRPRGSRACPVRPVQRRFRPFRIWRTNIGS